MSAQQQKRKLQDTTEIFLENKKPHNEEEVSFSEIAADSTHIDEDIENVLVNTIVESQNGSQNDEGDEGENSFADTIVSACITISEKNPPNEKLIKSLQETLKRKVKEINDLKKKNEELEIKVTELKKESNDLKNQYAKDK